MVLELSPFWSVECFSFDLFISFLSFNNIWFFLFVCLLFPLIPLFRPNPILFRSIAFFLYFLIMYLSYATSIVPIYLLVIVSVNFIISINFDIHISETSYLSVFSVSMLLNLIVIHSQHYTWQGVFVDQATACFIKNFSICSKLHQWYVFPLISFSLLILYQYIPLKYLKCCICSLCLCVPEHSYFHREPTICVYQFMDSHQLWMFPSYLFTACIKHQIFLAPVFVV